LDIYSSYGSADMIKADNGVNCCCCKTVTWFLHIFQKKTLVSIKQNSCG